MASAPPVAPRFAALARPSAWRWAHVAAAALAMVLTLPGRTHGLGLFTEPLLKSLDLDRQSYGFLNLLTTLLGALFCLPCGWLLDRFSTRAVFLGVTAALGAAVLAMARWTTGAWAFPLSLPLPGWAGGPLALVVMADLFLFLLLTRGLGQSALSVVSLALVGRSAGRRSGMAMGAYAVLTTLGFVVAFVVLGEVILSRPDEWRGPWAGIGLTVLALGLAGGLLVRDRTLGAGPASPRHDAPAEASFTLGQALRKPAFWTFSVATAFYGMVAAGTSLFHESILAERGFGKDVFVRLTQAAVPAGLAANLVAGWLATRWPLARLMALACAALAGALVSFPFLSTEPQAYAYALTLAAAGGAITVCFFTAYRQAFGPARLGSIQGGAQMLTVLFSGLGPLVFAAAQARLGAYAPLFPALAAASLALALLTWAAGLPAAGAGGTTFSKTDHGGTP
jgi:hypothetical protein